MAGALCDLRDVISALGSLQTPGCVLSIDFSSAFDSVRHDYLFEVLQRRGVAKHFVDVLRSLYAGAASQLRVNGELTAAFPVGKSVRQGAPASMLYFAIVLAPLLTILEERLEGLALASCTLRVSSYADDAYMVLRNHNEAAMVMDVLQEYGVRSGLCANPDKCGALALGGWRKDIPVIFPYVEKLKVLGVTFHADVKASTSDSWGAALASVRGVLSENATRALGLSQRARYINMYALSKMYHVAQVFPVPKGVSSNVVKAASRFLWRGQFFTTSMSVACTPRGQGGLDIPDVRSKCMALFAGRWQDVMVQTPDSFAGEWLQVLLGAFPLGTLQRKVWTKAWHYNAFHATRTTASSAPVDVAGRDAIRGVYKELVDAAPVPVPRVVTKSPMVGWQQVWANVSAEVLSEDVRDAWWKAVHDLTATRDRLHRIQRSDTRTCPTCAAPDTLAHRLCRCTAAREVWRWTRATLSRLLGSTATPRTLLQPDFCVQSPERQALW